MVFPLCDGFGLFFLTAIDSCVTSVISHPMESLLSEYTAVNDIHRFVWGLPFSTYAPMGVGGW